MKALAVETNDEPTARARWARRMRVAARAVLALCLSGLAAAQAADPEVLARGLQFPEGTIFVADTLYFVDYASSDVLRLAGRRVERVWHEDGCGANGLVQVPAGLLVACYDSGNVVRISLDGKTQETTGGDDRGRPFLFPNDLTADARGGVYFSASGTEESLGKVYYRTAAGRVREVAANIHYSNGLAVSPDGMRLYVAESVTGRLLVFDIGADGALGAPREFVRLVDILSRSGQATFTPDGLRIDRQGRLFVGLYRGGGFAVISPQGRLLKLVPLPGEHHANLAITPDGRSVVVTSSDDAGRGGALIAVPNPVAASR